MPRLSPENVELAQQIIAVSHGPMTLSARPPPPLRPWAWSGHLLVGPSVAKEFIFTARRYNAAEVTLNVEQSYRKPVDARGAETFARLVDPSSPILRIAAAGVTGGDVTLDRSPLGGLRATVRLPG